MWKQRALYLLRGAGLLEVTDAARMRWLARKSEAGRRDFARVHGAIPLPPDRLAYDAYGTLDWDLYWGLGREVAGRVAERIRAHAAAGRVLEWGCGPARIVRHLPDLLGPGWEVYGSDRNADTVRWCSEQIQRVRFARNGMEPPLPFPPEHFECVYAVSVFTHLSEGLHRSWADEMVRVLKPGGVLICTLHGEATRPWLRKPERVAFDAGRLVVRRRVPEGSRCFTAYQPEPYVRAEMLGAFEIIEHVRAPNQEFGRQDVWVARKP